MQFKPCLLIMQPRQIPEVIKNYSKAKIDKVWFRAFNEPQVCIQMNNFIKEHDEYSHFVIISDDGLFEQEALDCVLSHNDYDIFTGYCNLHFEEDGKTMSKEVALCKNPLGFKNGKFPLEEDYDLYTFDEIKDFNESFKTYFAGLCLTMASRELWMDFPFMTYNGCCSDHNFSYKVQQNGVEIYTHKDAFVTHLRILKDSLKRNWLVGKETPRIIVER